MTSQTLSREGRLLSTLDLAARWGVHPRTLVNERAYGRSRVPYVRVGPGTIRYRLADVEAFEAARLVAR